MYLTKYSRFIFGQIWGIQTRENSDFQLRFEEALQALGLPGLHGAGHTGHHGILSVWLAASDFRQCLCHTSSPPLLLTTDNEGAVLWDGGMTLLTACENFLKSQNGDYVESLFSGLELRLGDSILGLLSCFLTTTKRIKWGFFWK